jgi:hypothetical protein
MSIDTHTTVEPHLQERGEALYLADAAGARWRVYDVLFGTAAGGPGRRRGVRPPGPRACAYRLFKSADGTERVYRFARGGDRVVTTERLVRQLRRSEYASRGRFDPTHRGPW